MYIALASTQSLKGRMRLYDEGDGIRKLPSYHDMISMFDSGAITDIQWHNMCHDREFPIFELLTVEFINALGQYLSQRTQLLAGELKRPIGIIEIGAGDGRLTHFLSQVLGRLTPGKVQFVATDSGKWKIRPAFPVELLDHRDALQKYQPQVVLCSWMPYQHDWTAAIRAMSSVQEYILVGEPDDGACGHPYRTWGATSFLDTQEREEIKNKELPYVLDKFERRDIDEVSQYQICRSDYFGSIIHSKTISFRKIKCIKY